MTGDEHQPQDVVVDPIRIAGLRHGILALREQRVVGEQTLACLETLAPAPSVDSAPLGDGEQPRAGIVRDAAARPCHESLEQRLLGEILRPREVAGVAGQAGDDPRGLGPPHGLHGSTGAVIGHDVDGPRKGSS